MQNEKTEGAPLTGGPVDRSVRYAKATHSAGCNYHGADGIKRFVAVTQYEDETIRVGIRTYWDGEEAEPLETNVRMGKEAFGVMLTVMNDFALDRERFVIHVDET